MKAEIVRMLLVIRKFFNFKIEGSSRHHTICF
jgi:hypothetical protein